LLRTTRQHYHHQIADLLIAAFPDTVATQPELIAHHYAEAGRAAQAVRYWQQAGQRAVERSAYLEALNHLTRGLGLLPNLPDTPERAAQELTLHLALGQVFMATKGQGAPEVEQTYTRARALCQEMASTQQLFPSLAGLCGFYVMRGALQTARELGEQLLSLAEQDQDPALLLQAHQALGGVFLNLGEVPTAHAHWGHALALSNAPPERSQASPGSDTPGWSVYPIWPGVYGSWAIQPRPGKERMRPWPRPLLTPSAWCLPSTLQPGSINFVAKNGQRSS
jgi:hypothetical protein